MRRLGACALLLALAACGSDGPTYADGEEVAERLGCDGPQTSETVAGPDTTCSLNGADVTITDWQTSDSMRDMYVREWEEAGYVTFDVGDGYTVFVQSSETEAVKTIKDRL